jgi:CxxC motif-containing protein (DUF1111 family)
MKQVQEISPGHVGRFTGNGSSNTKRKFVLRSLSLLLFLHALAIGTVYGQAVDPGPRGGTVGAGAPIANLSPDQTRFFQTALSQFTEVEGVTLTSPGNGGLGPTFNSNSCGSCHSQPSVGGTSPSTSAYPFIGPNPQVAAATLMGASNTVPFFVTSDGPVREARFKYVPGTGRGGPGGNAREGFGGDRGSMNWEENSTGVADGSVHDLFTIAGRSDAPGCTLAQEDFQRARAENNLSFRIPTPLYGLGLLETISDATILNSFASTAGARAAFGIGGVPNRSGNDTSITRFGWKAQNKSGLIFAGEAYNVEMGVTNELFPNERGFGGVPPPTSCLFNPVPEDETNFLPIGATTDTSNVPSDVQDFALFMKFLDQPTPACTGTGCSPSIQNGLKQFKAVGCALCHTPSMTTDTSDFTVNPPGLSGVVANLFSDLLLHHMGEGLADGISQGNAGPDQFRTSPLWGIGQRVFFLHDGRTSDLLQAIEAHAGPGSEANTVIRQFNALTTAQKQDLLNFLRSL